MTSRFKRQTTPPTWRRIAVHTWGKPADPTIYGLLDVDVAAALEYVKRLRERTGLHVTLTHVFGKAVATTLRERPDANAILRRNKKPYLRDTIDIFFMVAYEGGENLSGALVRRADEKSVAEIAVELIDRAERVRKGKDRDLGRTHSLLGRIPAPLRGVTMRAVEYLTYDLDLDLRFLGLPYDQFGSAMITNVGNFDVPMAFAPLVPFSRCPILLTMGAVEKRPVVVNDEVVIHPVMTIGGTFDHRILDGFAASKLAARFREIMSDPEKHMPLPNAATDGRGRSELAEI